MKKMKAEDILNLPLGKNDSGAKTIKGYLKALLLTLWQEGEGFSGKRPFGNSGWEYDLHKSLLKAGLVEGKLDEDGYIEELDSDRANKIIEKLIKNL